MKKLAIFVVTSLLLVMGILLIMTAFRTIKEYQNKVDINIQNLKEIKNVILIIACSLRADHLGCYGYERKTSPNIDKLAKEGILFKNCFAQAPYTVHSVPSIITSKYPRKLFGLQFKHYLPDQNKTFAEFFKNEGFYTLGFMASPWTNKAMNYHQGFDYYFDTSYLQERYDTGREQSDNRMWGDVLNYKIINKLETIHKKNFFLQILYKDVHLPYKSFPPFRGRFASEKQKGSRVNRYDEAILNFDAHIGELTETLKQLNLLNSTLIIITSDHGDGFGRFHEYDIKHGNYLYNTVIKPPLIFFNPSLPIKGVRSSHYVTPMDILPTTLDLIGIQYDQNTFDGVSQKAVFHKLLPSNNTERFIVSETNFVRKKPLMRRSCIMIDQRWKLIHNYQTSARKQRLPVYELYDLKTDPNEINNLANKKQEAVNHFVLLLEDWQKNNTLTQGKNDSDQVSSIESIPPELESQLKALGYLN